MRSGGIAWLLECGIHGVINGNCWYILAIGMGELVNSLLWELLVFFGSWNL
jgi:hypothetical protein